MSLWLRQSTAATVKVGPFVDVSDGYTAKTGLSITQPDIRLSKNGGDIAQTNNSAGATHDENGYYDVPLNTTDTDTPGRLYVMVSETGALPCWREFTVVPANIWDSFFSSDYLQVDVINWNNAAIATPDASGYPKVTLKSGTGAGEVSLSSGTVTVGTNNDKIGYTASTVSDKNGYSLTQAFPSNFSDLAITATTGKVTVGTNDDKTGYTAATVLDKIGYSLSSSQTFNITGNLSGTVGSVSGDVGGKVLGGGGSSITGTGARVVDASGNNVALASVCTDARLAHLDADISSRLAPTVASRTLDVSATGEAGVDWANVGTPASTVALTNTTVGTVTTLTGNTAQTGDSFARIGATGSGLTSLAQASVCTEARLAHLDADVSSRLSPTTAGRTLDVSASGEAGLDWSNIGGATTTQALTNTTVGTVTTITNWQSISLKKATAYSNFMFVMRDSTNHNPATSKSVTAERVIDSGTIGSCTNSVSEVSNGIYRISFSTSDLNGDSIMFRFSATSCDDLFLHVRTQS